MSRKPYKQFHHGKGFPKTQYKSKPFKWIPFSYIDTYNAYTGRFRSRRKFGSDGWAYKDLDMPDNHKPYDHVHDIKNGKRQKTVSQTGKNVGNLKKLKRKGDLCNA